MESFLHTAVQSYGIVVLAAGFFLFFLYHYRAFSAEILRYFTAATLSILLLVAADGMQSYYATLPYPTAARMFFAASGYSLRVIVLYCFMLLFCRRRTKRVRALITIPSLVNILVSFSAFFTEKVFSYTENNVLIRGPLILVPFAVSFLYFVILIIEGIHNMKMGDKRETMLVLFIFMLSTVTTTMEVKWAFKGILPASCILGTIFYYMHFMSDSYSYDKLTDACIRNRLYEDVRDLNEPYGVIALDVNDLKRINDTCGHLMGDQALIAVSHAARDCLPRNARLYRIGGDEFVIICRTREEAKVTALAQQIRKAISATPYTAAMGSAIRSDGETLETVIARADALLYQNKQEMKAEGSRTPFEARL